jgi:hypothetical protein
MLDRIDDIRVIHVEQLGIAFHQGNEVEPLAQREVGSPVGESVTAALRGNQQRGAHPLPGLLAPVDLRGLEAGRLPQLQLLLLRTRPVATRNEHIGRRDSPHGGGEIPGAAGSDRIVSRPDEQEVVVHDPPPLHQIPALDVGALRLGGVHQHRIGVSAPRHRQRRAAADRDHLHLDTAPGAKGREQRIQQPAVLGAGRGGQHHVASLCPRQGALEHTDGDQKPAQAGERAQHDGLASSDAATYRAPSR